MTSSVFSIHLPPAPVSTGLPPVSRGLRLGGSIKAGLITILILSILATVSIIAITQNDLEISIGFAAGTVAIAGIIFLIEACLRHIQAKNRATYLSNLTVAPLPFSSSNQQFATPVQTFTSPLPAKRATASVVSAPFAATPVQTFTSPLPAKRATTSVVSASSSDMISRKKALVFAALSEINTLPPTTAYSFDITETERTTIMAQAHSLLTGIYEKLNSGKNVPVPSYYHATKAHWINKIITDGAVTRTPAACGFGAYVSTRDEYSSYGNGGPNDESADGYTIVFDSDVIESRPAAIYAVNDAPISSLRIWCRVGLDLPVNSDTVAYIAMNPKKMIPTGHQLNNNFKDGSSITVVDRRVSEIICYALDKATKRRTLPTQWKRYGGDLGEYPANATDFMRAPYDLP